MDSPDAGGVTGGPRASKDGRHAGVENVDDLVRRHDAHHRRVVEVELVIPGVFGAKVLEREHYRVADVLVGARRDPELLPGIVPRSKGPRGIIGRLEDLGRTNAPRDLRSPK